MMKGGGGAGGGRVWCGESVVESEGDGGIGSDGGGVDRSVRIHPKREALMHLRN